MLAEQGEELMALRNAQAKGIGSVLQNAGGISAGLGKFLQGSKPPG
jgi:hypothetical protein